MTLILASTSPRRADLLRAAGVAFEQVGPGLDDAAEGLLLAGYLADGLAPPQVVARLGLAKLLAAARTHPGRAILAADTICHLDGELLGKARDLAHARQVLGQLRDRTHEVLTGLAVIEPCGRIHHAVERSTVRFAAFDDATLDAFLAADLWQGKAGAYGIQDPASAPLIAAVEGCVDNVKGLPPERALTVLRAAGLAA